MTVAFALQRGALLALALSTAAAAAPPASAPVDPFLAQLAGTWDMVGAVNGKPVHHRGQGRWVLVASYRLTRRHD
jgi:hypothetical protein